MSISRIYQSAPLALNATHSLDEKASHHIARVLRASVGELLTLFNGEGGEYTAVITHIDKKSVRVELTEFHAREVESPLQIHLAQGIARGEKMDFIIQKAVELGVTNIIPLVTARCNVRLDSEREEKRLQHWQAVAISACEQSGRNHLPTIAAPQSLAAWLPSLQNEKCFVLSPFAEYKLLKTDKLLVNTPVVLLIGPEGGLTDDEIETAIKNKFTALNLGPRVLRTETATIAAVTVLQFVYGDVG